MAVFFSQVMGLKCCLSAFLSTSEFIFKKASWILEPSMPRKMLLQDSPPGVEFFLNIYFLQNVFFQWMLLSLFTHDLSNEK